MSTMAFGFNSEGDEEPGAADGRDRRPRRVSAQLLYKDVSGYLSTPSDEGNYAYKVGTGGYAAEISNGIFRAVANIAGEVTTQYILRYIPDIEAQAEARRCSAISRWRSQSAECEDSRAQGILSVSAVDPTDGLPATK